MLIENTRYKWFGDYNGFEYKNYLSLEQIPDTSSLVNTFF